ncbi:beta-lactamase class C and other penicillin binding protein [Mollisia scopiformis]|uniref:Beta-lactamase class C and other penicillin binding protein n=1 Tax=Mollisia scopiformis TaxID=149040 RepID=A0A194XB04_MOLSC|nr:beta-lactamase class C and other penicillin binding protein [Mollisia scopiformis]KUJ17353.1 beta-lactamase class C and other penicillin binding protein [Mollisia scopiformis]
MAAETFEQRVERACNDLEIPGLVMVAGDRDGKFYYEKAIGNRSLKDGKPDPMPLDATMWLASCTKLITSVAVMQCVEKGLLKLDDDVSTILPELKDMDVLVDFETGPHGKDKPVLKKNTKTVTLRNLLTHTSGLSYDVFNPVLMRYRATQGIQPSLYVTRPPKEAFHFPLLFQPGEQWEYGVGLDWAGWMVERATGVNLEEYFKKNIWGPLGVKSMSFYPNKNPAIKSKLADMSIREGGITMFGNPAEPNGKTIYIDDNIYSLDMTESTGGSGLFGAPLDYFKLLQSLLRNDEKVLKKGTVDDMFKPQLSPAQISSFEAKLAIPEVNVQMSDLPAGTKVDYGLGAGLIKNDIPGRWKAGTLFWSGYPNLHWYIDRESGIAGMIGSQLHAPGDPKFVEYAKLWGEEMFRQRGKEKL